MQLADYLKTQNLRAREFARRISVADSTMSRILAHKRRPNAETLAKIVQETRGQVGLADFIGFAPVPERAA